MRTLHLSNNRCMTEVIVLQHAECEGLGAIQQVLDKKNIRAKYIRSFAGEPVPEKLGEASGLIVMGGPMGVYEQDKYPFLRNELNLIGRTVADEKPVLGVCLGSQLLAAALGAKVTAGPRKEIGWYPVQVSEEAKHDPLWITVPREFTAFHWHGDIFNLPDGAVRLASSALTETQAYRYGSNAYGFLFHLEVTPSLIDGMVSNFEQELREASGTPEGIAAGAEKHLASLQPIGEQIFTRWSDTVRCD